MPINVVRLSDGAQHQFSDICPQVTIRHLKDRIKKDFLPKFPNGCRLIYNGRVMKSRRFLKHYDVVDNDTVEMDDRKNWSETSSSSSSCS